MFRVLLGGLRKLFEEDLLEERSLGKYSILEFRNNEQRCQLLYSRIHCCAGLLRLVCYRYTDFFCSWISSLLEITERKALRYLSYADTKDRGFSVTDITLYSGSISVEEFLCKCRPTSAKKKIEEEKSGTCTRPNGADKSVATVDSDHYPIDCRLTDLYMSQRC
jgi:hypothetical protein